VLLSLGAGIVLSLSYSAALGAPNVEQLSPRGLPPGEEVELTIRGPEIGAATALWTSFPAEVKRDIPETKDGGTENKDPARAVFRVTVAKEFAGGIGAVRVITPSGVSEPVLLLVDELPTTADNGQNRGRDTAQQVELPAAIDGQCEPTEADYYRFAGKSGQRVSLETYAARLGSSCDPMLRLLASDGRELAFNDDDASTGADARLSAVLPADGEYLVEIRDARYRSGPYRLRIGDFPLVSTAYPPVAVAGQSARFQFAGADIENVSPVERAIPAEQTLLPLAARRSGGQSASHAAALVSPLTVVTENEPNEQNEQATPASLPVVVCGRLEQAGDRDLFRFDAKKGQLLSVSAITRRVGSPSAVLIQIQSADGKTLEQAADNGAEEPKLRWKAPEDGVYYLAAEEVNGFGGPEHAYAVSIQPGPVDVTLQVKPEKNVSDTYVVAENGTFVVHVECDRAGFDEAITLSLAGVPEGFTLKDNVIAKGKNDTKLSVQVPGDLQQSQMQSFRLEGRATIDGREVVIPVGTTKILRRRWPQLAQPPLTLDGQFAVGIGPAEKPKDK